MQPNLSQPSGDSSVAPKTRDWRRIIIIGVVVFVAIFIIVFGAVFKVTGALTKVFDELVEHVKAEDYISSTLLISENMDSGDVKNITGNLHLQDVVDTSWHNRAVEGKTGTLEGTVDYSDGTSLPLVVEFVKQVDGWKIIDIRSNVINNSAPSPVEIKYLENGQSDEDKILGVLEAFYIAVEEENFNEFFVTHLAQGFQSESSVEEFDEAFSIYYGNLSWLEPLYDGDLDFASNLNDDGSLNLVGTFENETDIIEFEFLLVDESGNWRLNSLIVDSIGKE
jgi:hypothetical protein